MAKASSPVRLQKDLMRAATVAGEMLHRSAAEQIEYWATIGRSVSKNVSPDSLLAISTGLAMLKVEPVEISPIDPDDVFSALENHRNSGRLSEIVTESAVKYQASKNYKGKLERIEADGSVTVVQFSMGEFTPEK